MLDDKSQKLLSLIGEIYEASLNSMHWNIVMQMISEATGSASAGLFFKDKHSGRSSIVHSHGLPETTVKLYNSFGYRFDPSGDKLESAEKNKAIVVVNPEEHQHDNIFYSLFAKKIGVKYAAGVMLQSDSNTHTAVAIQRSRELGMFPLESLQFLELIAPHIERSLRIREIHEQLLSNQRAIVTGLDGLSNGVIILGKHGKVLFKNAVADKIIGNCSNIIALEGGTLMLHRARKQQQFDKAVYKAQSNQDYSESIGIRETDDHFDESLSLILTVMSSATLDCETNALFDTPATAVVYLVDLGSIDIQVMSKMMQLYKLTNTEAKISVALANGVSVGDIAAINGVKKDTIRTQLKSIFRKTGTSSQSTLVRLVVGLATVNNHSNAPNSFLD